MFIAEAAPIHHLDVFLVIYKLITGGCRTARTPPATAIIVWPRPDRAICSSRRAAPLPPRSCLGVVPNAHPSSLLCCTNKGQEDTRKRAQSLTRVPASNQKARTPRGPQKKRSLVNKKPTPAPTLLCSSLCPCFSFTFPNYPGTPCPFSIPLLSLRLQAKPARFSKELEEGSRKPFMVWEGGTGRIHFPSPQPAPRVQSRSTQSREQYPSFNHAYSIWHPFAYTPQASTAASRSDNKRIQRIWRATQDDLNAHTLLF